MRTECEPSDLTFNYSLLCCGSTIFIKHESGKEFRFTNGVLYRLSVSDGLFKDYEAEAEIYKLQVNYLSDFYAPLAYNFIGKDHEDLILEFITVVYGLPVYTTAGELIKNWDYQNWS